MSRDQPFPLHRSTAVLIHLRVRDYAVLDDVSLELGPGLSALSGETGAGKSLLVGALSLLLGERATAEVVRVGADRAVVEGVFDVGARADLAPRLAELGVEPEDGLLILKREVAAEGRNRAWVNGSPATAALVRELGAALVDLHGQHEHQALLRPDEQRRVLDAFAGATAVATEVEERFAERTRLTRELDEAQARRRELEARADYLRFQRDEIGDASLEAGDDVAIDDEARRLEHAGELAAETGALHERLYAGEDALSDQLAAARASLERLARLDPALRETVDVLDGAYQQAVEAGRRLGDYAGGVEHDPERLDEVRRRLDLIFRLKLKYGPQLDDVIETGRRVSAELAELEGAAFDQDRLRERVAEAGRRLAEAAARLTAARGEAAAGLEAQVDALLPELGMAGGTFMVALEPLAEPGAGGAESVELRVSLNQGFEPRSLRRVASGGELSRIMLALKTVLAAVDRIPTLVFDEIDAGVGGAVAVAVATRLRAVAEAHQVLVVTHLPQLASRAHAHLMVEKGATRGVATTGVRALDGEERVREIARMLGGDPESQRSREHARELLGAGS
ncbi:MAG: DNA repair protein RecN [Gemmatimonadetes bacterium]|nr:DNA repair protein RecN [Gemmatimonadota bacterium]